MAEDNSEDKSGDRAEDKSMNSLVKDLTHLFDKQEAYDVVFSAEGKTIGVHKVVLNVRSEPLYDMASGWSHGEDPISLEDISYDTFKTVLRYMYSGEIELSDENVMIFLAVSTRFKMIFLEEQCSDHYCKSLSTANVCAFMNDAAEVQSTLLQQKCRELFSKQTAMVSREHSFKELSQPALSALLDVDQMDILEIELFHRLSKWMEQKCKEQGLALKGCNMRPVIGDALYKIRFPTMTVQDFANTVTTIKELLTDTEMTQVFQKITVFNNEDIECPFPSKFRCQVNHYYVPFLDMERLLTEEVLFNKLAKQHCDLNSALKFVKNQPNETDICLAVLSFRLVFQCCADLANSSAVKHYTDSKNQATRNELYDEFLAWQDIAKSKNVSDIMTKYMQLRKKLDKLYRWSF